MSPILHTYMAQILALRRVLSQLLRKQKREARFDSVEDRWRPPPKKMQLYRGTLQIFEDQLEFDLKRFIDSLTCIEFTWLVTRKKIDTLYCRIQGAQAGPMWTWKCQGGLLFCLHIITCTITSITTRQCARNMDGFLKEESLDNTMISERHFKKRYCWPVYNGAGACEPIHQDKEEIVNLSHFPTAPLDKTHGTVTSELRKRKEAKIYTYNDWGLEIPVYESLQYIYSYILYISFELVCLFWSPCRHVTRSPGGLGCGWVMSHEDWM